MKKLTYFLSDFHLGATYFSNPLDAERRIVKFLDSIKGNADEIYLMGDILDYWYEYKHVVPRGYTRFFGKIAELSDLGIKIYWFIGNHDIWIYDYLPNELGIEVIDGISIKDIKGKRFFLNHGDAVGKRKASFRFIRWLFRNKFCQALYSMLPSCVTVPFAHRWSSHSRKSENGTEQAQIDTYLSHLVNFSKDYSQSHPDIDYYIFGHLHIIADEKVSPNARCIVLGDWIDKFSYATFNGTELHIERYSEPNNPKKS